MRAVPRQRRRRSAKRDRLRSSCRDSCAQSLDHSGNNKEAEQLSGESPEPLCKPHGPYQRTVLVEELGQGSPLQVALQSERAQHSYRTASLQVNENVTEQCLPAVYYYLMN